MKMKFWKNKHWQSWIWNFVILNFDLDDTLAWSTRNILFMSLNIVKTVEQGIILAWDLSNEFWDEESQNEASLQHAQWLKTGSGLKLPIFSPYHRTSRLKPSPQLRHLGWSSRANVTSRKSALSQSVPALISGWSLTVAPSPQVQDGQMGNLIKVRIEKSLAIWTDNHTR